MNQLQNRPHTQAQALSLDTSDQLIDQFAAAKAGKGVSERGAAEEEEEAGQRKRRRAQVDSD